MHRQHHRLMCCQKEAAHHGSHFFLVVSSWDVYTYSEAAQLIIVDLRSVVI